MTITAGTKLGRYEIRSKLGEGGMGEVYLARDTQLDRFTALKVLPSQVAGDPHRLPRFLQEARAASALSHPNVAHIYEIGQVDGTHFIAMGYVEGTLLDKKISGRPLPVSEAVDFAIQIADALDEAHARGITHRDIKSSNIMITPRGVVKVLDFGLAKLALASGVTDLTSDSEIATRVKTSPGVVMGTVNYMSPEQALGRDIDNRSDIFSFGVVLYEMVTGRLPFTGATVTETIDRIAHAQPEAVGRLNYEVPAELEVIIKKTLRKDRGERYQSIHDVLVDLKELRRDLDLAVSMERSTPPSSPHVERSPEAFPQTAATMPSGPPPDTRSIPQTYPTSSAEYIVAEIRRHRVGAWTVATLLIVGLLATGIWIYKLSTSTKSTKPLAIDFTRLTSGGKVGNETILGGASVSPDGKYVVFWTQDQDKNSCYVRQISTNSLIRIVGPTDTEGGGTTFSPDGEFIYFNAAGKSDPDGSLFKVPVLGGTAQKILEGIWSPVSFSPDGKQIAYVRLFPATGESWLVISNADGSGTPQTISKRKLPDYYSRDGPAWSPDGKRIAVGANTIPEILKGKVVEVPVEGGPERVITEPRWSSINRMVWVKDGSGLVLTAFSSFVSTGTQVWYVSYPDGAAHRITNDLNGYGSISLGLTADSDTIVTVQEDFTRTIWSTAPNQDAAQARQISNGKYEGTVSVDGTPDGRIVYVDLQGSGNEIWIMKADGTDKKQLTSDGAIKIKAFVTRDGRYILFNSNRSGGFNIWRMDIDGNNQKQLTTNETFAIGAVGSNDGKWVVYQSLREGRWTLWKMSIDGGESTRLTDKQCALPAISPDGKLIACLSPDEKASLKYQIAIVPFDGGPVSRLFDLQPGFGFDSGLSWTPDGRAITFINNAGIAGNVYSQPIDSGSLKALTNFKSDTMSSFAWTRDGKQLIVGRGPTTDDVVLIKGFR